MVDGAEKNLGMINQAAKKAASPANRIANELLIRSNIDLRKTTSQGETTPLSNIHATSETEANPDLSGELPSTDKANVLTLSKSETDTSYPGETINALGLSHIIQALENVLTNREGNRSFSFENNNFLLLVDDATRSDVRLRIAEPLVDPELRPMIQAWKKFLEETIINRALRSKNGSEVKEKIIKELVYVNGEWKVHFERLTKGSYYNRKDQSVTEPDPARANRFQRKVEKFLRPEKAATLQIRLETLLMESSERFAQLQIIEQLAKTAWI
jgi:hypothetical protein